MNASTLSLRIWLRAQGIYLLLNLPCLVVPPMFLISELYALSFGIPALLLFCLFLNICARLTRIQQLLFLLTLAGGLAITLAACYGAAAHFLESESSGDTVWETLWEWRLFPGAALFSAACSICTWHRSVYTLVAGPGTAPDAGAPEADNDQRSPANPISSL